MRQEVSELYYLKSKNPQTFVTETFKVGIIKFQGRGEYFAIKADNHQGKFSTKRVIREVL